MSDAKPRRTARLFILGFLAFQIGMPLRYYLGERGYDERFSWRMFSTLRMRDCAIAVAEARAGSSQLRDVSVSRDVQAAWVSLLERVRMPVVVKYLERRCDREALDVTYTARCTNTDGSSLPTQTVAMHCADRSLRGASP